MDKNGREVDFEGESFTMKVEMDFKEENFPMKVEKDFKEGSFPIKVEEAKVQEIANKSGPCEKEFCQERFRHEWQACKVEEVYVKEEALDTDDYRPDSKVWQLKLEFNSCFRMVVCGGCSQSEWDVIKQVLRDDSAAVAIFRAHGVLKTSLACPHCGNELSYRDNEHVWYCSHDRKIVKKGLVCCGFSVSAYQGTWLDKLHIPPWQNLLFCNAFIRKHFTQRYAADNLNVEFETVRNWKSFCSEVCEHWMNNQQPIGGPGIVVEVGESKFSKSKYGRGHQVTGVWVLGGMETVLKRKFIVPVPDRTADTLIPLIERYVLPGSIIHTDCWKAYSSLGEQGFIHCTVNHSKNIDPSTGVHTQNIKCLWKDMKSWVLRAGNKQCYYYQYFAKYLFQSQHPDKNTILHHFLLQVASLYPPPSYN